jgi:hypothetical protein
MQSATCYRGLVSMALNNLLVPDNAGAFWSTRIQHYRASLNLAYMQGYNMIS